MKAKLAKRSKKTSVETQIKVEEKHTSTHVSCLSSCYQCICFEHWNRIVKVRMTLYSVQRATLLLLDKEKK